MPSLMNWSAKLTEARAPLTVRDISNYAPVFFWQNAASFRTPWCLLVALSALRNLLAFLNVCILSRIISEFSEMPKEEIVTWYAALCSRTVTESSLTTCISFLNALHAIVRQIDT